MASSKLKSFAFLALATSSFLLPTGAVRHFNKRSDLDNIQPISESGYAVPLQGMSCQNAANCTDTLPVPTASKVLTTLTIARGNVTYTCSTSSLSGIPSYVSQQTELYDVGPLIQFLPTEQTLHDLVPQFQAYDYSDLSNSTLQCIGDIYTQDEQTAVTLTGYEPFTIHVNATVQAPNPSSDSYWAKSISEDGTWEVYRVETAGGAVPASCNGQGQTFELSYAAEYWFYR